MVHAATPALEAALGPEDPEVVEAVAMNAAADDSLALIGGVRKEGAGSSVAPRRCVVVAVVPDQHLRPLAEGEALPSALRLVDPVGWKHVESIHVDDLESEQDVAAAADGDESAFERVIDEDLMWYDVAERDVLAAELESL